MIEFIAQTTPAVYIPSAKMLNKGKVLKYTEDKLPSVNDIKKPTHVDVHNGQLISSPKNLECLLIHSLKFSNIAP